MRAPPAHCTVRRKQQLALPVWSSSTSSSNCGSFNTSTRCITTCLQQEILKESLKAAAAAGEDPVIPEATGSLEMSHMESPEADEAHRVKLCHRIDDLFQRLPMPEDPMAAALQPTEEEERTNAAAEVLKEAVREAYWRKKNGERLEDRRLAAAMARYVTPQEAAQSMSKEEALRKELEEMKAKVKRLEAMLKEGE